MIRRLSILNYVGWMKRHKILTGIGALLVIAIAAGGSGSKKSSGPTTTAASTSSPKPTSQASANAKTATPSPSGAAGTSVPSSGPSPAADADTLAARGWIHKSAHYTNEVQVSVQSIQAGLQILQNGGSDPSATASFSQLLQQAHDQLDDAQLFLVGVIDGHMKTQREEAWYAANELKDAMSKARSYLDDQKPSELADFTSKYEEGSRYWNEAITALYAKAGIGSPPTI